jgi:aspartyl-tRNA(Asn)/glutamyl-tRNA(Gln) amidotransferase subunit A
MKATHGTTDRTADDELCAMGAVELQRRYRDRSLSPVEVTRATLERIERVNPELCAFISVDEQQATASAKIAEAQFAAGIELGPMQGVPFSLKDNIRARGARTTAGSRTLIDAPLDLEDSGVVKRLRASGAILLGKVNLAEYATGVPDADTPFGIVQNPRRIGYQPGASSSGSAAAIAAGLGVISLGTDTGGSIRYPAGLCGVVGLKPTYGLVSLSGVIFLSEQFDHVGPLARSVADAAACLDAIAGYDPDDPNSVVVPTESYYRALGRTVSGLRVGVPTNPCYRFGLPDALAMHERARQQLFELGLIAVPLHLPRAEDVAHIWETITLADCAAYHDRLGMDATLYGRDFLERYRAGKEISALRYAQAMSDAAAIRRQWLALFDAVDIIALPGNAAGAPRHGVTTIEVDEVAYPVRQVCSPSNRIANLTGCPALQVPAGEDDNGMPIGVQLFAPPFREARLLAVGHALEAALDPSGRRWDIDIRRRAGAHARG